jgi:hypothetical protein
MPLPSLVGCDGPRRWHSAVCRRRPRRGFDGGFLPDSVAAPEQRAHSSSNTCTHARARAHAYNDALLLKRICGLVCWTGCGRMQNESFRSLVGAVTRLTNLLLVLEEIAEEREREGSIELTSIAVRGDV